MNEYYKHCLYDSDNEGDLQLPWTTPFCLSVLNQFLEKKNFYIVGGNPGCLFLCLSLMDSRITTQKNLDTVHIQNENSTIVQYRLYMHTLNDNAKPLALVTNVNKNVSSFP